MLTRTRRRQSKASWRTRPTLLCAVFFIAVGGAVHANDTVTLLRLSDPTALTLHEAIRLALRSSRQAVSARLSRQEQKFDLDKAERRYKPTWSVSSQVSESKTADAGASVGTEAAMRLPTGGALSLSWSRPILAETKSSTTRLSLSQPLLKGFGLELERSHVRRARIQEEINTRSFRDTAAGIIRSVINAWRQVQSAESRASIAKDALERARRQLQINRALTDAGRLPPQDLVQFEASVADREYQLIDSEHTLRTANESLVDILDLADGTVVELMTDDSVEVTGAVPSVDSSLTTAFDRRTDWYQAEAGVVFAEMAIAEAENNELADLSFDASADHSTDTDEVDWRVGVVYRKTFGDSEPEESVIRAKNSLRRSLMQRDETRQAIRREVTQTIYSVQVALRQIALAEQGRALTMQKLQVERRKMNAGLSSAFQLERFEDDLIAAQNRELEAKVAYQDALTGLDSTLGTTLDRWGINIVSVGQ